MPMTEQVMHELSTETLRWEGMVLFGTRTQRVCWSTVVIRRYHKLALLLRLFWPQ